MRFPPPIGVGTRVWSPGYREHGPLEGPTVNIPAGLGGTIVGTTKPWMTMDQLLYDVRWDNGQTSRHYGNGLSNIGRFATLEEYRAAIVPEGPVELTLGPKGGFRHVKMTAIYDGQACVVDSTDRAIWSFLKPYVTAAGLPISEKRMP